MLGCAETFPLLIMSIINNAQKNSLKTCQINQICLLEIVIFEDLPDVICTAQQTFARLMF